MVVLGCTEFPVIVEALNGSVPDDLTFIDSTIVLAEVTVKLCKGLVTLKQVMG